MKQTKIVHFVLAIIASATMVACNGSGASAPTTPIAPPGTFTQGGPLNPYALAARLQAPVTIPQAPSIRPQFRSNAGSIQPDASFASTTAVLAGVIGDMVPGAGPIFGPINVLLGAFGSNAESAHLQDQIDAIDTTLAAVQTQINQLQAEITADNALYNNFVQQTDSTNACSALLNWDAALRGVYATPANYVNKNTTCGSSANNTTGIGNLFSNALGTQSVKAAAIDSGTMQQLQVLSISYAIKFQNAVNSVSATNPSSGPAPPLAPTWNPKVYGYISPSSPKTTKACTATPVADGTAAMLVCGYQYLIDTQLPTPGTQLSTNVITTINSYNQLLFNMYQQDVLAMQYAYTMEATSNYMNYYAYRKCLITGTASPATCASNIPQIYPWEGVPAIAFSVGEDTTQINPNTVNTIRLTDAYFTAAQQNLLAVYAARVNALYKSILTFTISDSPLSTQSYAPPPGPITLTNGAVIKFEPQNAMYSTVPAETLSSTVNGGSIPGGLLNSSGGLLYQYGGINQVWTCLTPSTTQSLTHPNESAPTINLRNCASAFPNSSSSSYNGVTMSAYVASATAAGGVVPTPSLNVNTYCGQTTPTGANAPSEDAPTIWSTQLICSVWGGNQFVNSTAFPGNATFPPSVGGYLQFPGNYETVASPGESYFIEASSRSVTPTFYEIGSSLAASPGYAWGFSGNFGSYSTTPWGIMDGGFPSGKTTSEGQAHVALLEVTLPNGYIFPFYLMTASFNAETSGTDLVIEGVFVCTAPMQGQRGGGSATPPGVSSCVQNDNSTGGLTVTTADGNSYTVKFQSSDAIEVTT